MRASLLLGLLIRRDWAIGFKDNLGVKTIESCCSSSLIALRFAAILSTQSSLLSTDDALSLSLCLSVRSPVVSSPWPLNSWLIADG